MALGNIPFYASLLFKEFPDGKKPTTGHVLVFGSIDKHDEGPLGCIASNKTIAEETGLSVGRTANIISELAAAGWIRVYLNEKNQRKGITPLMTLHVGVNPLSRVSEPTLHASVNIDNSKKKTTRKQGRAPLSQDTVELAASKVWGEGRVPTELVMAMTALVEDRFERKKDMTANAVALAYKKLNGMYPFDFESQVLSIEQTIAHGWSGLFEVKNNGNGYQPQGTGVAKI